MLQSNSKQANTHNKRGYVVLACSAILALLLCMTTIFTNRSAAHADNPPPPITGLDNNITYVFGNPGGTSQFGNELTMPDLAFLVSAGNIAVDPPSGTNPCASKTSATWRPATDVFTTSPVCQSMPFQGQDWKNPAQMDYAGEGWLTNFMVGYNNPYVTVNQAGTATFRIRAAGGWVLAAGGGINAATEPVGNPGNVRSNPSMIADPWLNQPVVADHNVAGITTVQTFSVSVTFPTPGNYGLVLDTAYAPVGNSPLTATMDLTSYIPLGTPPTGTWLKPTVNPFTVAFGKHLSLSATVDAAVGSSAVKRVIFQVQPASPGWQTLCSILPPLSGDTYSCSKVESLPQGTSFFVRFVVLTTDGQSYVVAPEPSGTVV